MALSSLRLPHSELEALELPEHGARALLAHTDDTGSAAVVNHGNPGVPGYLRDLAQRMAKAGIATAVLAGDGRLEPRPLEEVAPAEREEWRTEEFAARYLGMTRECFSLLHAEHADVGLVGFCGGGWQAVRLAAEGLPASRVVAFHAALRFPAADPRPDLLSYLPGLRVPAQFHFGAEDELTPARDIAELEGRAAEVYVYPGAGHGFLDPEEQGDAFDADAAELATQRMLEFLTDGR